MDVGSKGNAAFEDSSSFYFYYKHSSPKVDYKNRRGTGVCYTSLEFPSHVYYRNNHGQKINWSSRAPEAKNCSKNCQKVFGRISENFCFSKVLGNRILSGKYVKTIPVSLSNQKLWPIKNRQSFEQSEEVARI